MSEIISTKYLSDMNKELSRLKNHVQDNKLNTFSSIYTQFSLQNYVSFGLLKSKTRELSKLRISAYDLLIERGRNIDHAFLVRVEFVQLAIQYKTRNILCFIAKKILL